MKKLMLLPAMCVIISLKNPRKVGTCLTVLCKFPHFLKTLKLFFLNFLKETQIVLFKFALESLSALLAPRQPPETSLPV